MLMLVFTLFILVTAAATVSGGKPNSTLDHNSTSGLRPDPSLLSYKVSAQWPRGYCKTESCRCERAVDLPNYLTLHGFCPIYRGPCTDLTQEFDLTKIQHLQQSAATVSGGEPNPTLDHNSTSGLRLDPKLLSYKLSIQWPRGYCKTKSSGCERAVGLPDYFTLHGLWPIYRGQCTDSTDKFDLKEIENLQQRMVTNWPNLKTFGDESKYPKFWDDEWKKHGIKCSLYSVHSYFLESLDLLKGIVNDVQQTLGLTGTGKKLTTAKEVKAAFKSKKMEPYVYCKYGSDGKTYYFHQIVFCLDNKKEYDNCPAAQQPSFCQDDESFSYGDASAATGGLIFLRQLRRLVGALPLGLQV